MQWWIKAAVQGDTAAQCIIGEIYLTGLLDERVPVGTFDKDVPRGMKTLRAVIDQKSEAGAPYVAKNIQSRSSDTRVSRGQVVHGLRTPEGS